MGDGITAFCPGKGILLDMKILIWQTVECVEGKKVRTQLLKEDMEDSCL